MNTIASPWFNRSLYPLSFFANTPCKLFSKSTGLVEQTVFKYLFIIITCPKFKLSRMKIKKKLREVLYSLKNIEFFYCLCNFECGKSYNLNPKTILSEQYEWICKHIRISDKRIQSSGCFLPN